METLENFVKRFCHSVGCYSHPNKTPRQYSLKKYNTSRPKHMGVFGWVRELKRKKLFEVSSYVELGDKTGISHLADCNKENYQYGKDGILFYIQPESKGYDYQKTVKAIKAIIAEKT